METTEPYQCIVVRHKDNGEYHSSLVFSKHINGYYQVTQRVPLCGQSTSDFTITVDGSTYSGVDSYNLVSLDISHPWLNHMLHTI